ncbi:MAG: hypothetical protein FWD53_10300 [Phycisphaerales bacterium]|nr:hypothetical protein [Phycisphaerales bacterium]
MPTTFHRGIIALVVGISCGFELRNVSGVIDGDYQLLQQILDVRAANQSKLATWQGDASITTNMLIEEEGLQDNRTATASYLLDVKKDQLKWTWRYTSRVAVQNGKNVSSPDFLKRNSQISRIKTPNMVVRHEPNLKVKNAQGEDEHKLTLVIYPGDIKTVLPGGDLGESLDPRFYFTQLGYNIDEYLEMLVETKDTWPHRIGVSNVGPLVTVEFPNPAGGTTLWEFDLEKGGNLVLSRARIDDESTYKALHQYQQINEVWVPALFHYEKKNIGDDTMVHLRRVAFSNTKINEPIDPEEFTIASLRPPTGTYVSDHRIGLFYHYGGELATAADINRMIDDALKNPPPAKPIEAPVGRGGTIAPIPVGQIPSAPIWKSYSFWILMTAACAIAGGILMLLRMRRKATP